MVWTIRFEPVAEKEFGKLDMATQANIRDYLDQIQKIADPRTRGKALRGDKSGLWRYRVDKYRIICRIKNDIMVILIVRIGKRDKVYD